MGHVDINFENSTLRGALHRLAMAVCNEAPDVMQPGTELAAACSAAVRLLENKTVDVPDDQLTYFDGDGKLRNLDGTPSQFGDL